MNRNKSIIISILVLILILGSALWFFSMSNTNNSRTIELTDQQKLDILSKVSTSSVEVISNTEKQKILNKIVATTTVSNLNDEEKLQILNIKN